MGSYTVWIVSPEGYTHAHCFDEIGFAIASALTRSGHRCSVVRKPEDARGRTIVLGPNLLAEPMLDQLPRDLILYNLEQIDSGSPWLTERYLALLRRYPVWDYSPRNISALNQLGIPDVVHCGIGYVPELTRIARTTEEIDVLFYGSMNERRHHIVRQLVDRGLRVEVLFGSYGRERDAAIARSRIVLNVHFYEAKVLELVRVSYLLANRRFVVSEVGRDPDLERAFEGGIAFAPYEALAETCARYLSSPSDRRRIALQGYRQFAARRQEEIIRRALAATAARSDSRGSHDRTR